MILLGVELAQGTIGFVQYFTDLPIALVAAHLVGAAVLVAASNSAAARVDPHCVGCSCAGTSVAAGGATRRQLRSA